MTGKMKFFNWKKGFGFIAGDDGKDYFVGYSGMIDFARNKENKRVKPNEAVTFDVITGDERGPVAVNVRRVE